MTRPHSELKPTDITAVIDTREQCPWSLAPLRTQPGTLATGDYSVFGLEHEICIERKSLPDLIACIGLERERFERELGRMANYSTRAVIVEATWLQLTQGGWRSRLTPTAAVGSVLGWMANGIPFLFAGDPAQASTAASRLLFIAARRRFRELASFQATLKLVD